MAAVKSVLFELLYKKQSLGYQFGDIIIQFEYCVIQWDHTRLGMMSHCTLLLTD